MITSLSSAAPFQALQTHINELDGKLSSAASDGGDNDKDLRYAPLGHRMEPIRPMDARNLSPPRGDSAARGASAARGLSPQDGGRAWVDSLHIPVVDKKDSAFPVYMPKGLSPPPRSRTPPP